MRYTALLFSVLAFASCSPVDASKEEHAAKTHSGELRTFSSQSEALAYVRSRVAQCDTGITLKVPGNGAAISKNIAQIMSQDSHLAGMKSFSMGNLLMFEPEYAEDALLLRAVKDPSIEASLTPSQKSALNKARSIVNQVCAQHSSDYDRALALHDYLIRNATYSHCSAAKNLTSSTSCMLQSGMGICEGYARAYGLLLTLAGIENRYVGGSAQGDSHAWNMARLGGQWVHIDCTYDDPLPDAPDRALRSYFGMSDAQIAVNHHWNRSAVPSASSSALYYPFRNGLHFATMKELIRHCATHKVPSGYVTAYVDELGQPGVKLTSLLAEAEREVGQRIVYKYTVSPSLPCAFSFINNF